MEREARPAEQPGVEQALQFIDYLQASLGNVPPDRRQQFEFDRFWQGSRQLQQLTINGVPALHQEGMRRLYADLGRDNRVWLGVFDQVIDADKAARAEGIATDEQRKKWEEVRVCLEIAAALGMNKPSSDPKLQGTKAVIDQLINIYGLEGYPVASAEVIPVVGAAEDGTESKTPLLRFKKIRRPLIHRLRHKWNEITSPGKSGRILDAPPPDVQAGKQPQPSEVGMVEPKTASEVSEAAKQWQELFHSQAEQTGATGYVGGRFTCMDGRDIRLPDGEIRRIPDVLDREPDQLEMTRRLSGMGHYIANHDDRTLIYVAVSGSLWVGPLTAENRKVLDEAGYTEGNVGSILGTGWSFAYPYEQEHWEKLMAKSLSIPAEPVTVSPSEAEEVPGKHTQGGAASEKGEAERVKQEIEAKYRAGAAEAGVREPEGDFMPVDGSITEVREEGAEDLERDFKEVEGFLSKEVPQTADNIRKIAEDPLLSAEAGYMKEELERRVQQIGESLPAEETASAETLPFVQVNQDRGEGVEDGSAPKTPEEQFYEARLRLRSALAGEDSGKLKEAALEVAGTLEKFGSREALKYLFLMPDEGTNQVLAALCELPSGKAKTIVDLVEAREMGFDKLAQAFRRRATEEVTNADLERFLTGAIEELAGGEA